MRIAERGTELVEPDDLLEVRLFSRLDEAQRRLVLDHAHALVVNAGETIVEEGTLGNEMFALLAGEAAIQVRVGDSETIQVGTLEAGHTFGELGALLREPRAATILATEDSRLLRLAEDDLVVLLEQIGPLGLALSRELARDLEAALGERNALEADVTPDRVVVPAQDLSQSRTYVARYYLATVRGMLGRNRLAAGSAQPSYTTELRLTPDERERWFELFGAAADAHVPFTYHTSAWTMLLMQLVDGLGVNFLNLSHHRTQLTYDPEGRYVEPDEQYGLQLRLAEAVPQGRDRVGLDISTRLTDASDRLLLTASDLFVVTGVDRATVKKLGAPTPVAEPPAESGALSGDDPDVSAVGLALAEDLGARYGRLSGNLNPIHTSRAAARLLGQRKPVVQHLCMLNLVLRTLTGPGPAPRRLEATFLRPVSVGQTVELRFDDERFEIVDADETLLIVGSHDALTSPVRPPRTASPPTSEPEVVAPEPPAAAEHEPETQATVDPLALQRLLDGDHAATRERVRRLLCEPRFRREAELPREEYRERVLAWCRDLAGDGLGALSYPEQYGGRDAVGEATAAFETIAFHDLSLLVKFGVQFGLFGGAILHLGTAVHHERYLRDVANLALPGCFALTETGHGSNARAIRTTARYDAAAEQFVIHTPDEDARKDYIGNAACHGRLAAVFAQLEVAGEQQGVHALLVPIRDEHGAVLEGVSIEDCGPKLGLDGVDNGRLRFDHVRVGWDALLNRYGHVSVDGVYSSPIENPSARFFTMLSTLVGGRLGVGLAGLSATKSALTIAVRYALERRQFGPSDGAETLLLDYLTHQRRLLPALATVYALNVGLQQVVDDFERSLRSGSTPRERMELETLAAGMKALATWHATTTIQGCREACGGKGYLAENRFAALKADTDVFTTFEGDNTVLLQLVAKTLLTGYREQFEDMALAGLVRYVLRSVLASAVPTPASRRTDEAHLRDPAFQVDALRSREDLLLADLARRLKREIGRGTDAHDAFIRHQDRVVATAQAHIERAVVERFAAVAAAHPEIPVLARLRDLYALSLLDRERGWFLEEGLFAAAKTRAITRQCNKLCVELRPHAADLVDAFGIPDALLDAPIAGVRA